MQNAGNITSHGLERPDPANLGERLDGAIGRLADSVSQAKSIREAILGSEPENAAKDAPSPAPRSLEARIYQFEVSLDSLARELQRISAAI